MNRILMSEIFTILQNSLWTLTLELGPGLVGAPMKEVKQELHKDLVKKESEKEMGVKEERNVFF